MSTHSIVLHGTLIGGIVGPGDETTGYILKMADVDADMSGLAAAAEFSGKPCMVAGTIEERKFPVRGRVRVLRATQVAASAAALSRQTLRASVFLSGVLRTGVIRPGGEGPSAELASVAPEVDVSAVARGDLVSRFVAARGSFELVDYVTRGLQFVFKVSELKEVDGADR
jgi:hypothetical protein